MAMQNLKIAGERANYCTRLWFIDSVLRMALGPNETSARVDGWDNTLLFHWLACV